MPKPTVTYSMDANKWLIPYSVNMPLRPTQEGNGFYVNVLPDTCEIDYLLVKHTAPILASSVQMTVEITAASNVVFDSFTEPGNNPPPGSGIPPSVRFMLYKNMNGEFGRWWSNPGHLVLQPGTQILSVSLSPDRWSSVFGKFGNTDSSSLEGFNNVLASPAEIGMTFGGGYFFGHGIKTHNGSAKIKIVDFKLV